MFKKSSLILFTLFLILTISILAFAITGQEVLDRVDDTQDYESSKSTAIMRIYNDLNDRNDYISQEVLSYTKGEDASYMEYLSPSSVEGIKVLSREDLIYAYFPSTGRARPIAENNRNASPTGAGDFNYEDMSSGNFTDDYDATIVQETNEYYILDATPKDTSPYTKLRVKVMKSDYTIPRINYYNEDGMIKYLLLQDYQEVTGQTTNKSYNVPMRLIMINESEGTMTALITTSIEIDIDVSDCFFDSAKLETNCRNQ